MLEDKLLIWKFKHGSETALRQIYEKYYAHLISTATALLNDFNAAEDVVQDFFIAFAGSAEKLKLHGNFKAYLATCVANLARDRIRKVKREPVNIEDLPIAERTAEPLQSIIKDEESARLNEALSQLPYEQREAIILHLHGNIRFTQIAKLQNISVNTIRSQYRYGLQKLRSLLNGEVIK